MVRQQPNLETAVAARLLTLATPSAWEILSQAGVERARLVRLLLLIAKVVPVARRRTVVVPLLRVMLPRRRVEAIAGVEGTRLMGLLLLIAKVVLVARRRTVGVPLLRVIRPWRRVEAMAGKAARKKM